MATKGIVRGIVSNLVTVEVDGPVSQNEICYISVGGVKLMAEVIKVIGKNAFVQVFESTRGMRVGDSAEFQGHMLEVTLGPGMLSRNYDGLQNDLDKMQGVFLKRGEYTFPLDENKKWAFKPLAKAGEKAIAGTWLGEVDENSQPHKIMVPFTFKGEYTIKSVVAEGEYTINDTIAVLTDAEGNEVKVTMVQKRKPSPATKKSRVHTNCWKPVFVPLIQSIRLLKAVQALSRVRSVPERPFCSTPSLNRQKPIS